jgi:hypothetical protein
MITLIEPRRLRVSALALLGLLAVGAAPAQPPRPASGRKAEVWQKPKFDRITLAKKNDNGTDNRKTYEIEILRLPKGRLAELAPAPTDGKFIGESGLPPIDEIRTRRTMLYRVKLLEEPEAEYALVGATLEKHELYEDLLRDEARALMKAGRMDDAVSCLAVLIDHLKEGADQWPLVLETRIIFRPDGGAAASRPAQGAGPADDDQR